MITLEETKKQKVYMCEHCNAKHVIYYNYFNQKFVGILSKIWKFCIKNNTNVIERNKIGLTSSQYAEMAKLQWFWLIYRAWAAWMMPRKRVKQFFAWEWLVAKYCERDVMMKTHKNSEEKVSVHNVIQTKYQENYRDFYKQFVEYVDVE